MYLKVLEITFELLHFKYEFFYKNVFYLIQSEYIICTKRPK